MVRLSADVLRSLNGEEVRKGEDNKDADSDCKAHDARDEE